MPQLTLTFDNGPTPATTPKVLEVLKNRGLKAYFCLVASQLLKGQEQVDIANQTQADGHVLVNHSLTHSVALGDDPTPEHAAREVDEAHRVMAEKLRGWQAGWFRPFGRGGDVGRHLLSQSSMRHIQELGYSVLLWNSVPRDWEDVHGWVDTALTHLSAQEHTVVVLHDLNTGAMDHLDRFLEALSQTHDTTLDLPETCVPVRKGEIAWSAAQFDPIIT